MEIGKLPHNLLAELLSKVPLDERVVVGPGIGIDAAVIEFGDRLLVAKTDPITFATDLIGWYAVNVNANDIASMGARPKWLLATILLPRGCSPDDAKGVFDQLLNACTELDITLVGGHTEITYDLPRPIVIGCMLGETDRAHLVTAAGARVGDDILVSKPIAVEGTALLAREARDRLIERGLSQEQTDRSCSFLFDPGISVVRDARVATDAAAISAMHDPTEGGLATGLMEIAQASGLGVEIDRELIPVFPETEAICHALGLDPLVLIASGSLLITCSPADSSRVLTSLQEHGLNPARIGRMTPKDDGLKMKTPHGLVHLPSFARDEIARFFSGDDTA